MSSAHARLRTIAALAVGITVGAVASSGTALLLYTGQGFLRAAGLLVSSTLMAIAAGLWAGAPEPARTLSDIRSQRLPGIDPQRGTRTVVRSRSRGRWLILMAALIAGGLFAAFWSAREPLREVAVGSAVAVLLVLALPAYAAGNLLAGLHARDRGPRGPLSAVAAAAMAGSAIGVLLAATMLIPKLDPFAIYYGGATLVALVSMLDRTGPFITATHTMHMTDRVVIVTGASDPGQLGYTVARRFLEAGARVVISGRSSLDASASELGGSGEVLAVQADLTSEDDIRLLVEKTRDRWGRIDALINVAGGLSVIASVEDTTPEEWQREIDRNAGTALRMSRAALPLLRESRGAIINFASPAAMRAPARLAAYSAAKAAVVALTRSLAIEEKNNGVRVNAVAPGIIDTAQNRSTASDDAVFVTREEVASVVLFLAGPAATGITGETINVLGETIR